MTRNQLTGWLTLVGVALIWAGCHKDPTSSVKPDVENVRDRFHFQMNDVRDHDTLLVYYWQMDGTSANIDQSASIQGGRVTIVLEDDAQAQVYQTDMTQNGSFVTSSGASGMWRIRISLTHFTGMIDFRAQRR